MLKKIKQIKKDNVFLYYHWGPTVLTNIVTERYHFCDAIWQKKPNSVSVITNSQLNHNTLSILCVWSRIYLVASRTPSSIFSRLWSLWFLIIPQTEEAVERAVLLHDIIRMWWDSWYIPHFQKLFRNLRAGGLSVWDQVAYSEEQSLKSKENLFFFCSA